MADAFERVHFLKQMGIDTIDVPVLPTVLIKAYASRVARLKLTRFKRLQTTTRDIGLPCFLQVALWRNTDEAVEAWLMRVAEIRRLAMQRTNDRSDMDWHQRYDSLLKKLTVLKACPEAELRESLDAMMAQEQRPSQTRAEQTRQTLLGMSAYVRRLLRLILALPIECRSPDDWLNQAMVLLRNIYVHHRDSIDAAATPFLPPLWR